MKRRILSMVMALAMVLSLIPAVHAAEAGGSGLVDLLPGNEVAKEAFLKILEGGILGNEEESLQELKDLIDKEYDRPRGTAGYVADENSYYVSLGDSTVTGDTEDSAYKNYGYNTKVPTSAPYLVADELGLDYVQLAFAGLRVSDLRYILDKSFSPDDYTKSHTQERISACKDIGTFEAMRNYYVTELAKADLVTVSIGGCNFTDFINVQLSGKIAEVLNNDEALKGVLNGMLGAKVKSAISEYVDLDSKIYAMNWEGYIGKDGKDQLDAALTEVETELKAKLIAEGIEDPYKIDVADLIEMPALHGRFVIKIPVAELMCYALECFLYSYVTFVADYEAVFNKIHEIVPDAELLILSMYNPTDELTLNMGDAPVPFGEYYGYMVKAMSLYLLDYAEATPKTTFVDVYSTESKTDEKLENNSTYELMDYIMSYAEDSADFHATKAGHVYMKDQILAALAPEAEGLPGDADGSGEVDYLDAMIVLQYHTGVVGEDALDLKQCDVDKSGEVDYLDAMMILQYHTGVIGEF